MGEIAFLFVRVGRGGLVGRLGLLACVNGHFGSGQRYSPFPSAPQSDSGVFLSLGDAGAPKACAFGTGQGGGNPRFRGAAPPAPPRRQDGLLGRKQRLSHLGGFV
jgi:hypothetical protein